MFYFLFVLCCVRMSAMSTRHTGRSLLKPKIDAASVKAKVEAVHGQPTGGDRREITLDDQRLQLVPGQRGKLLLLVDGYTLPRNNVVGPTTYWCCRRRTKGTRPCNARVTTTLKENGLHKMVISRNGHNHTSTWRP